MVSTIETRTFQSFVTAISAKRIVEGALIRGKVTTNLVPCDKLAGRELRIGADPFKQFQDFLFPSLPKFYGKL